MVDSKDTIKILSTPVKSTTTSIRIYSLSLNSNALDKDVQAMGESLATKSNTKLILASERLTEGVLFYEFEEAFIAK